MTNEPTGSMRALVVLSTVVMVSFGSLFYAYSVLITDEAAGSEFSTSLLSTAYGGFVLIGGLLAFAVGRYADRRGVRPVFGVGAVLGCAGLGLLSVAGSGAQVVAVSWLLMGPAGAMLFYEPAFIAVDQWFSGRSRGRAIAVLTVIAGLAGPIFVPLTGALVTSLGWRPAARVLAVIVAVVALSGTAVTPGGAPKHDRESAARPSFTGLLRDPRFALYTGAVLLFYGALQATFFHRIAAFEAVGFAVAGVSAWAGVSGLLGFPGRWLAPRAAARFAQWLQAGFLLVLAASVLLIVAAPRGGAMPAHFIIFGLAFGGLLPLRPVIMSDWFSGPDFGHIMGAQWSMAAVAGAAGPWLVGLGRDAVGGYDGPMLVVGGVLVLGAVLTVLAARAPQTETSS
ncbi:MAG: MFS transporter [Acidimicrobiia bacterium]|nr:MFS transporter [Acidimicrobiia bacterium]